MKEIGELKWNEDGLIPAVVVDDVSGDVLMLAYMNRESLEKTIETQETWFYSRSRQKLWHKGATSGNRQKVVSIYADCDRDALVVRVVPLGPACHTGEKSCFFQLVHGKGEEEPSSARVLLQLEQVIDARYRSRPEGSYTTYLFEKGLDKILKKVGEEASEVIIAAKNGNRDELRYEAADLFYHLLVLFREQGLSLRDVFRELSQRLKKSKSSNEEGEGK